MGKLSDYQELTHVEGDEDIVIAFGGANYKVKTNNAAFNVERTLRTLAWSDMIGGSSAQLAPFEAVSNANHTFQQIASEANHPGIWRVSSITAGGVASLLRLRNVASGSTYLNIHGGEVMEACFRLVDGDARMAFGLFEDEEPNTLVASDGIEVIIHGDGATFVLYAAARAGAVAELNTSPYVPVVNTWYRVKIEVNSSASEVNYYLYDFNGVVLWSTSIINSAAIPTNSNLLGNVFACETRLPIDNLADLDWVAISSYGPLVR